MIEDNLGAPTAINQINNPPNTTSNSAMAKYAILQIFEPSPVPGTQLSSEQRKALGEISTPSKSLCKNDEDVHMLGKYSLAIKIEHSPYAFCSLLTLAHNAGFQYRVAYLDDLQWVICNPPDPELLIV